MVTSSQQTSIVSRYTCIIYSFHIILLLCAVWRYAYAHCTRVAGVLEEEHLYWVSFENANALNAKILTLWYDIKACQRVREILLNASILIECVSLAVFYLIFFCFSTSRHSMLFTCTSLGCRNHFRGNFHQTIVQHCLSTMWIALFIIEMLHILTRRSVIDFFLLILLCHTHTHNSRPEWETNRCVYGNYLNKVLTFIPVFA